MLAGRKLLLADDSITIQKVVELTFADEGVQVISVGNGTEAIERLEEILPDVVLADVFMPGMTGYQVCEHIKQNEKLKHIPVMLLVGSFEPFDEAEAHRVGADDTLTKPFQSIRSLVDKVGGLLRRETPGDRLDVVAPDSPPAQPAVDEPSHVGSEEALTAELPAVAMVEGEDHKISNDELELMTADTQQLSPEMLAVTQPMEIEAANTIKVDLVEKMETETPTAANHEASLDFGEVLLDLGKYEPASVFGADDDILDIDLDAPAQPAVFRSVKARTMVLEREVEVSAQFADTLEWHAVTETHVNDFVEPAVVEEAMPAPELVAEVAQNSVAPAEVQEVSEAIKVQPEPATGAAVIPAGPITLDQLSPEAIDAIAHRVVAQLSEKAVQEIAWEVVPQLAELLIKRQLEDKEPGSH